MDLVPPCVLCSAPRAPCIAPCFVVFVAPQSSAVSVVLSPDWFPPTLFTHVQCHIAMLHPKSSKQELQMLSTQKPTGVVCCCMREGLRTLTWGYWPSGWPRTVVLHGTGCQTHGMGDASYPHGMGRSQMLEVENCSGSSSHPCFEKHQKENSFFNVTFLEFHPLTFYRLFLHPKSGNPVQPHTFEERAVQAA